MQINQEVTWFLLAGRKAQAIELYLKGIEELNKGISLDVTGQGTPIVNLRAKV
jgi:hypothetical protein